MKVLKKIATIIVSVLLWCVILLAALFAFTTLATSDGKKVQNLFGFTPLTVKSDSMVPVFSAGDLIIIHTCDTQKLKKGDIITFHTIINNEYALNTHRIEEIAELNSVKSFTTKGDNNQVSDRHIISEGDIVGKYVGRIPKFGYVMNFLSGKVGFFCVIVLPMLLFFLYQIYHLIMVSINLKKAIAAEESLKAVDAEVLEAQKAREEAHAALEEAKRIKAEAEALKVQAQKEADEASKETKGDNEA